MMSIVLALIAVFDSSVDVVCLVLQSFRGNRCLSATGSPMLALRHRQYGQPFLATAGLSFLHALDNCVLLLWQVEGSNGCVIVAQMSCDGCLANDEYTQSKSSIDQTYLYVQPREIKLCSNFLFRRQLYSLFKSCRQHKI